MTAMAEHRMLRQEAREALRRLLKELSGETVQAFTRALGPWAS